MRIEFCCLSRKTFSVNLGLINIEIRSKLQQIRFPYDFRKAVNSVFKTKNSHDKIITDRDADYVISINRYLPSISLSKSHCRESVEKIKKVMGEISKKHEVAITISCDKPSEEVKEICIHAENMNIKVYKRGSLK